MCEKAPADPVTLVTNFENGVGRGVGTFLGSCPRGEGGSGLIPTEKPHAKTSPDNILFSRGGPLGGGPVSG